jgi:hypothetical protein
MSLPLDLDCAAGDGAGNVDAASLIRHVEGKSNLAADLRSSAILAA